MTFEKNTQYFFITHMMLSQQNTILKNTNHPHTHYKWLNMTYKTNMRWYLIVNIKLSSIMNTSVIRTHFYLTIKSETITRELVLLKRVHENVAIVTNAFILDKRFTLF